MSIGSDAVVDRAFGFPHVPAPSPSGGMVDATDSKSVIRKGVLVRVRPGAPIKSRTYWKLDRTRSNCKSGVSALCQQLDQQTVVSDRKQAKLHRIGLRQLKLRCIGCDNHDAGASVSCLALRCWLEPKIYRCLWSGHLFPRLSSAIFGAVAQYERDNRPIVPQPPPAVHDGPLWGEGRDRPSRLIPRSITKTSSIPAELESLTRR